MGINKPDLPEPEIEVMEGESKYEKVEGVTGWQHLAGQYPGEGYVRIDNQGRHVCEMRIEVDELDTDSKKWGFYFPHLWNISNGLKRGWGFLKAKKESDREWKIRSMAYCDRVLTILYIEPAWEEYRDHGPLKNGPKK